MKIYLQKSREKGSNPDLISVEITDINPIPINRNLLLMREGQMGVDTGIYKGSHDFYEYFPVLFLAHAKSELSNSLLVAYYIGEDGYVSSYIISGLPIDYWQENPLHLIDYYGYLDICNQTGETQLSIDEYFKQLVKQTNGIGINALLFLGGERLNFDQQKEFWKTVS